MTDVIRPNFFILGAPKCGTTALAEYLRTHPEIFISEPKEPHYFNEDFANRHTTTLAAYAACFAGAEPRHRIVGEASVFYLRSLVAVPRIQEFSPNAKFLVMLRNPVDMAHSMHSEAIYSLGENVTDFKQAWNLCETRRHGMQIPRGCRERKVLLYDELCSVGTQLRRLLERVDREDLHIVFFDDFARDPEAVYRNVLSFLDVPPDDRKEFQRINANKRVRSVRLLHWAQAAGRMKRRFGVKWGFGLLARVKAASTTHTERAALDPKFRQELTTYFKSDIRLLEELSGRDLSSWYASASKPPVREHAK